MIQHWDIITIGNLSRNRYWGEGDDRARRRPLCTCTLLRGEGLNMLVDPSLSDAAQMAEELDRRTGLAPADVDTIFLTHAHGDHLFGLDHFPHARWLAAAPVAEAINRSGKHAKPVEVAPADIGGAEVIPTPGHSPDHHSLRFRWQGLWVVVAADAAMTRDFWRERRGYFNSSDFQQATRTIEWLASFAEIVIPGHDNYFDTRYCH